MKILLLNPPGDKLYIRSYYCGSTSKANYLFQPLDLLMLSGTLKQEHEIVIIDCIADRLNEKMALLKINEYNPEVLVCVVSIVSWNSDASFLSQLKKQIPSIKIIATGDVFFENPEIILKKNDFIEAVIFDFISCDVLHYLNNNEKDISNMIYRKKDIFVRKRILEDKQIFSIALPRHELFLNKRYKFPFARRYPFTTVLTNFGCPFFCSFCIANRLGFRYRKAEEIIEELRYISKLGIKEIFFEDMTFGLPRENAINLCNMMIAEKLEFGWTCFSRVDLIDREFLSFMKQAGCHTIIFGVESASKRILDIHHKGYSIEQVYNAFKICREMRIETVATFILGLPEETRETCLETIKLSKEIGCDYSSFNTAAPRPGTRLRNIAVKEGLIKKGQLDFDHSGRKPVMPSKHLTAEEIMHLRKRAVREFYLRPSYILNNLYSIKTFSELKEHLREFCSLIINSIT